MRPEPKLPGYDGRRQIGVKVIPDPYEAGATITAPVNLRHDPLDWMFARGLIDEAERLAGERFLRLWQQRQRVLGTAMDKIRVDGGQPPIPITEAMLDAADQLSDILARIGVSSVGFLVHVLVEGRTLKQVALELHGGPYRSKGDEWRAKNYAGRQLKDLLAELSKLFGVAEGPKRSLGVVSWRATFGGGS